MDLPILGMEESPSPPDGMHEYLSNVRRDSEGYWQTLEGVLRVLNAGTKPIVGMHEYTRRGNQRWLVYEETNAAGDTTTIKYLDWKTLAGVTIATRATTVSQQWGTRYLELAGWLYLLTAEDRPVRWDGKRVVSMGWQDPVPAPLAAGNAQGFDHPDQAGADYAGAGTGDDLLLDVGTQRGLGTFPPGAGKTYWKRGYVVTYDNDLGQRSPPSTMVFASGYNSAGLGFGRRCAKLRLQRGPSNAVACSLWGTRNVANIVDPTLAPVFLIAQFSHAGIIDYIDHTPDGELAVELDTESLGAPPAGAYAGAVFGGALFLVGHQDPYRVSWSAAGLHEQFPIDQYLPIGSSATGRIIALTATQRGLFVFKEGGIYVIHGSFAEGFTWRLISERHGTTAPRGIAVVPELGVVFLDTVAGPSVIIGTTDDDQPTQVVPLKGIGRTWRRYAGADQSAARVLYDPQWRELWWHVAQGGAPEPTLGIVLHLETRGWTVRPGWTLGALLRTASGRVLVANADPGAPQLYGIGVLTRSSTTQVTGGATIASELRSRWVEFGSKVALSAVEVVCEALGEPTFTVNTRVDRIDTDQSQTDHGRQQIHTEHARDLWGVDSWSSGEVWADIEPARIPVDLFNVRQGFAHQIRLASSRMRLYALRLVGPSEISPATRSGRSRAALP